MQPREARYAQSKRNSDLRAAKRWRGSQRSTYPKRPPATGQAPGAAAVRAIERDGAKLTQTRISLLAAFPNGQPATVTDWRRQGGRGSRGCMDRAQNRNLLFNRVSHA